VIYVEGQRLILTGIAAAAILVWVLWDHIAHGVLLGWFGAFVIYALLRMAMTRAYRRRAAGDIDHRAWMTRALWALAVGGSLWGIASFLLYVPGRIEYQLFLVTILLGAVVSGLITLAVHLPAYLVFIAPFLAATTVRYGLENDPLHWGIALAPAAVLGLFINFGRYIQNSFVESLRLRMELAERNRELAERNDAVERANLAKSRFLAAASHDLRQPLHALNLFVAQLGNEDDPAQRGRLVVRIDAAVAAMNELFNALLDISKLDAGALAPDVAVFPVDRPLQRVETTFAAVAREKGLRLRVVPNSAMVRSDAILLERILLNLVSNAVRYTTRGGVIVACRRRRDRIRIEVWDSGIGIAPEQQCAIFGEFYQVAAPGQDHRAGLGLGLAIVERLCRLLDHPIELTSRLGKGSRFCLTVPLATSGHTSVVPDMPADAIADPVRGKLVVVVDDDALVLDGMRGVLQGWGCRVVTASSDDAAIAGLAGRPDLIVSDFRLAGGKTGLDVVAALHRAFDASIPAFLITGDTTTERISDAVAHGLPLLHKPVNPMALRAVVNQLLRTGAALPASASAPSPAPRPR
jgi:signal transduction histidine kinase/CheY-like chemotaxis protein